MTASHRKQLVTLCLFSAMIPALCWADNDSNRPPCGERRRPPQEAFDACKGKTEGAVVTISTAHGSFKATCKNFAGSLAAMPECAPPPPPPRDGYGPPPER
ncbi:MAG: hypothetical protein OEL57_01400 [Trichlorobacter sp.]|uniref:hypothetical protein n=1 Tax=Trichlorobacter sp. TaxID=2911007 RepID=UPI00256371AE|nr:hypothetical protein [Trichlorobacter sp.]MDK9716545.1 hypothetical protein [Trichlorobacter sp.]